MHSKSIRIIILFLLISVSTQAQFTASTKHSFYNGQSFISNIGQYGVKVKGHEQLDSVLYGFEGHGSPILFTKKGLLFIHCKIEALNHKQKEKLEKQGVPEEEIEHKKEITDKIITMQWLGANTNVEVVEENKTTDYNTYGFLPGKAYGYKQLTFKNLYNGIDLVYSISPNEKIGFEYSLQVAAGADISQVKMAYSGDVKSLKLNKKGELLIKSSIEGISQTAPKSFYSGNPTEQIRSNFTLNSNTISFSLPQGYDATRAITIDPFVTNTNNLIGAEAGKAKDIDFDYEGNIYVTGGGSGIGFTRLAKYNESGILQWTFNGQLTTPSWQFGDNYGGWIVEKTTGKIYLGQGFVSTGFRVIRLNTNGNYDNYISTANDSFQKNWKMFWSCQNGGQDLLIAGGSTNSNINLAVLTPPSTTLSGINITGIPYVTGQTNGTSQDISDFVVDPLTNELYSIYSSNNTPLLNNKIYKNSAPYTAASNLWNIPSGFNVLTEGQNRPYLQNNLDNSTNMLAVNTNYLFYWDGKNIRAYNKTNGALVATRSLPFNTAKMSGGILADPLNNLYIGDTDGNISSYYVDAGTFSSGFGPDYPSTIPIQGYSNSSVYDLAYNEAKGKIYACGDGFVASYDSEIFTGTTPYVVNITYNCANLSATAVLAPTPPAGSVVTYTLHNGNTLVSSNNTGNFINLTTLTNYTVVASLNALCSGVQVSKSFATNAPTISASGTNETCGNGTGQIIATGGGTVAPYTYSINGTNFFASGTFSGLSASTYTVTVKDVNNCTNSTQVIVGNNSFTPTFITSYSGTTCGNSTGTITAAANGGVAPYQYSINNGVTYQNSNIFSNLSAGQYQLKVKDFNTCISNTVIVDIAPSFSVNVTGSATNSTCGLPNGSITATPVGGSSPFQYSINGGATYQNSNVFSGLTAGNYTITIKDASNCTNNSSVLNITNTAGATVTAISQNSTCGNANGTITATAIGGTGPFQFSKDDGVTYQAIGSNVFTNLSASAIPYKIRVRDANNCVSPAFDIIVSNTAGATATAVSQNSTCGNANGTITATAIGGTAPFQFSKDDGVTYQAIGNNVFTNLSASAVPYKIRVRDANNCVSPAFEIIASNTAGATVTAVSQNSTCGNANGTITATAIGGTGPFQFSKDDGVTYQAIGNNVFTNLSASAVPYKIKVRDANNCVSPAFEIIASNTAGATVTAVSQNSTCGNANGIITATAIGGTGPFRFSKDDGVTYQAIGNNVFTNLSASAVPYKIKVRDANNCVSPAFEIIVSNTAGATVTAVSQNSTCGNANGSITATAIGGTGPFQFSKDDGVTYQAIGNNVFTNLSASAVPYKIIVKDANNCVSPAFEITVSNTAGPALTTTVKNATCGNNNGSIAAEAVGGTAPFQYSINGGVSFQNNGNFANLAPQAYSLVLKDANGCINSQNIDILATPIPILNVFAGNDTQAVIRQPIQLNAVDVNNAGFISYSWSPSFGLNNSNVKAPVCIVDRDFAYEVTATTADGCMAKDSIKIKVTFTSDIFVPTAFTPNGDKLNDVLRPLLIGIKTLNYFAVYDRNGGLVFKTTREGNGWDGVIKGQLQNTATYVWIAEAVDYLGKSVFRKGTCMLIR
jgi:gliding motility-associated-like protein